MPKFGTNVVLREDSFSQIKTKQYDFVNVSIPDGDYSEFLDKHHETALKLHKHGIDVVLQDFKHFVISDVKEYRRDFRKQLRLATELNAKSLILPPTMRTLSSPVIRDIIRDAYKCSNRFLKILVDPNLSDIIRETKKHKFGYNLELIDSLLISLSDDILEDIKNRTEYVTIPFSNSKELEESPFENTDLYKELVQYFLSDEYRGYIFIPCIGVNDPFYQDQRGNLLESDFNG